MKKQEHREKVLLKSGAPPPMFPVDRKSVSFRVLFHQSPFSKLSFFIPSSSRCLVPSFLLTPSPRARQPPLTYFTHTHQKRHVCALTFFSTYILQAPVLFDCFFMSSALSSLPLRCCCCSCCCSCCCCWCYSNIYSQSHTQVSIHMHLLNKQTNPTSGSLPPLLLPPLLRFLPSSTTWAKPTTKKRAAMPLPSAQPSLLLLPLPLLLLLLHSNLRKKKTKYYFFVFSTRRERGRKGRKET